VSRDPGPSGGGVTTSGLFSRIVSIYDDGGILPACAWCGRVRIDDTWVEPPPAALDAIDTRNTVSHSICDACASRDAPA
jgi:hypothetical protein